MAAITTFKVTQENVKIIGRTHYFNDTLWLALSGGGVEFSFTGTKAKITMSGDNIAIIPNNNTNYARIGIYVNGERVVDDMMNKIEKTYTVFESDTEQDVVICIVKLSESPMSIVGIQQIYVDSKDGIMPTATKERKIEFIGDSITCGYGVDDEVKENHFSTETEDVTKAYAYKTAQTLQADYSMVSYSGYGIVSGYSGDGMKEPNQIVSSYYDKVGFSYGNVGGSLSISSVKWDYSKYEPDLIVINLGTNDDSYCQSDLERQAEYTGQYTKFLKKIRGFNPNAKILCTLGIMGDRLYPCIEKAVVDYIKATADTNISSMKFDDQLPNDGYVADGHPTKATHNKASEKLTAEIKKIMNW